MLRLTLHQHPLHRVSEVLDLRSGPRQQGTRRVLSSQQAQVPVEPEVRFLFGEAAEHTYLPQIVDAHGSRDSPVRYEYKWNVEERDVVAAVRDGDGDGDERVTREGVVVL